MTPESAADNTWENNMKRGLTVVVILLIAAGGALTDDTQEKDAQLQEYCQMHEIWIDSRGEYGWPDYEGRFAAGECDEES